jgi:hypothetical protein
MIHIKTPCDANWQEMNAVDTGKYCGSCEKVVVDFSKMSDNEIKDYFNINRFQKTCGRFLNTQLDRSLVAPNKNFYSTLTQKLSRVGFVQATVFFMMSSFLWLSSCIKKQTTMGDVTKVTNDTCNTQMMGLVIKEDINDTAVINHEEDTIQYLKGEVDQHHEMIMGKVRMSDTITQKIKRRK